MTATKSNKWTATQTEECFCCWSLQIIFPVTLLLFTVNRWFDSHCWKDFYSMTSIMFWYAEYISSFCVSFFSWSHKSPEVLSFLLFTAEMRKKLRCRQQLAVSLLLGLWFPCCVTQTTPANTARPSLLPAPSPQVQAQPLRVRLAGHPRKHNEGRVELFHKGEWGTICDDDFSIANANVLCRQLGFVSATGWTHSAKYGKGQGKGHLHFREILASHLLLNLLILHLCSLETLCCRLMSVLEPHWQSATFSGKIWLDNVLCNGGEKSIEFCKSRGWGNSDCTHDEDAGVVCKDERIPGFVDSNVIDVSCQVGPLFC